MIKKHRFFPLQGKITSPIIKDIIPEVGEIYNGGKFEGIDFSLDDVSASDFRTVAKLVSSLKSIRIRKKVNAISNVSIVGLALLSLTGSGSRSIPDYVEIDFRIPEEDSGLPKPHLEELYLQYARLMQPLENENFSRDKLIEFMRERVVILGEKALDLGIVKKSKPRGIRPRVGALASSTPIDPNSESKNNPEVKEEKEVTE